MEFDDEDFATELNKIFEKTGFGQMHIKILIACGFLAMHVTCETMGIGVLAPAAQCDLEINDVETTILKVAAFIGMICSAYWWGYRSDVSGRKQVLVLSTSLSCCTSVISAFMPNYFCYLLMRFITGVFIAGPGVAALTYLSEFCTNENRPIFINCLSMFQGLGMLYSPVMSTEILLHDWVVPLGFIEFRPWRLLSLTLTLPGLIALAFLLDLPESPKFLFCTGDYVKSYVVINKMIRQNTGQSLKQWGFLEHRGSGHQLHTEAALWRQMLNDAKPIFHKPYLHNFVLSCCVYFSLMFLANGMGLWFTDMRNRVDQVLSDNPDYKPTVCDRMEDYVMPNDEPSLDTFVCNDSFEGFRDAMVLAVTFMATYAIVGIALDYASRKMVFLCALSVSMICGFALTWVNNLNLIITVFVIFLAIPSVLINLLGGAVVDFVPTHLRVKTMCFCVMSGRLGVTVGTSVLGLMLDKHCFAAFHIFASILLVTGIAASFLPMDKKRPAG